MKDNVNVGLGEGRVVRWAVHRNLIRSNPVNTDTEGPLTVSVLRGLN